MTISLTDFLDLAAKPCVHLRKGQRLFNLLYEYRPELANELMRTEANPFYLDDRLDEAIAWITARW